MRWTYQTFPNFLSEGPLHLLHSTPRALRTAAVSAGVLRLPPLVTRSASVDNAATLVIELRTGSDYRASAIEQLERPEKPADQQAKDIYAAVVARLRNDGPSVKP